MKVSINTVKQYTDVTLPLDELKHKINSQLGGIEETIDLGARYVGATIVRIVSCDDHPNADRLHVCKIDDGGVTPDIERDEQGLVQVVCGAPNARAGILVVWLPPKSTVPQSYNDKEPFVLDARPLRGVVSYGMLASPKELGLGDNHEGILEIPDAKTPGESFAASYGLDDTILDIENKMFTHRPDCFGVLGVAREIAGIQQQPFISPTWYASDPTFVSGDGLALSVKNESPEVVPRFMAVALKNIEVKPSPLWLQCELIRLGSKPINNVVDVTNYCTMLLGQPLHAYDYDKLAEHTLVARTAAKGEKVSLLNGKTYELDPSDIVICDGNGPVGLGGIMGGQDSEVSSTTANIVLECATFDMYAIRKTSMRHGVFTEATTRTNKGQSPLQNEHIVARALELFQDIAGAEVASQLFDQSADLLPPSKLIVESQFINERLGLSLTAVDMAALLKNVEIGVGVIQETLSITPPFWRTDLEIPEDIVEEVGRLYGFDKLPKVLPRRSIRSTTKKSTIETKQMIRSRLSRAGANEILNYSFVHERMLARAGQDPALAFRLSNALSPDLQFYRLSLVPSLLERVHPNIKAGYEEFALFELGKVHAKTELDNDGLPREFDRLGLVYTANDKKSHSRAGSSYYVAKRYLEEVLSSSYELRPLSEAALDNHELTQQMIAPFRAERACVVIQHDNIVGIVGEFTQSVTERFKLPVYSSGFELFISAVQHVPGTTYQPLSRFPAIDRDVCFQVEKSVGYQQLTAAVEQAIKAQDLTVTYRPSDIYSPEGSQVKNITLHFEIGSYEKTLTNEEASKVMDSIVEQVVAETRAVLI